MPPKKDASNTSARADPQGIDIYENASGLDGFDLPKSIVIKLARSVLPDSAKLQKDTVSSLVKGSTIFINYLAATAHDIAISRSHKTIAAADVIKALEKIQFPGIAEVMEKELETYRETLKAEKEKKATGAPSRKGKEKDVSSGLKLTIPAKSKLQSASQENESLTSAADSTKMDLAQVDEEEEEEAGFDAEELEIEDAEPELDEEMVDAQDDDNAREEKAG